MVSEYLSEYYYMNRYNWYFFIHWCLLVFIVDFDPMTNKVLIIMLITDPLRKAELAYLVFCSCFYSE